HRSIARRRDPGVVGAVELGDIEPGAAKGGARYAASPARLAVGDDRCVPGELVGVPEGASGRELRGTRNVTIGEFGLVAHVEQERIVEAGELLDANDFRRHQL